ncbi:Mitochondrial F1F0-ATP synthase, subunit d/ATP7 [Phaffia rhodozyma]|uniref:ATP synthase subunit d, mitochondrial n=1 Tax=Phaffia rhodozyma TaxID=264483 RepID=A0A0F7SM68_PHARH|nr:Mitochondrial F1F0-ATP synthase, subunit d/ATP7 [Phaffia rhodozyma]
MSKTAKVVVDWSRIFSTYGLGKETVTALNAFRKRASEAATANGQLTQLASSSQVDFAHYRSVLKNSAIVDELEAAIKNFKPVTIDPSKEIKAIEAFEAKAVADAEATTTKIKSELVDLKATLANIDQARPFEELENSDFTKAMPEITRTVDVMVSKGKWTIPGYKEKFGDLNVL